MKCSDRICTYVKELFDEEDAATAAQGPTKGTAGDVDDHD